MQLVHLLGSYPYGDHLFLRSDGNYSANNENNNIYTVDKISIVHENIKRLPVDKLNDSWERRIGEVSPRSYRCRRWKESSHGYELLLVDYLVH